MEKGSSSYFYYSKLVAMIVVIFSIIANESIFLSGIIEKQQAYQAEVSYTISPQWEFSAGVTWESIKNKDNNIGVDKENNYFQIELEYQL